MQRLVEAKVRMDVGQTLDMDWIRAEWQTLAELNDPRMVRFAALVAGGSQI